MEGHTAYELHIIMALTQRAPRASRTAANASSNTSSSVSPFARRAFKADVVRAKRRQTKLQSPVPAR